MLNISSAFEGSKGAMLKNQIEEILKRHGIKAQKIHIERLIKNIEPISEALTPVLLESIVLENLTIGESYFFRDIQTFEKLRKILKERPSWNILSIGCSRGEEVYSTAIVCNEAGVECSIKGIDVNFQRISQAKVGCYNFWSVRFLSKEQIEKYFDVVDGKYCVKEQYRHNIEFFHGNILDAGHSFFGKHERFDIIFIRRVLLYIERIDEAIQKISSLLKDDGFLIFGAGEYFPEVLEHFSPAFNDVGTFYKKISKQSEHTEIKTIKSTFLGRHKNLTEIEKLESEKQQEIEIAKLLKKTFEGIELEERIKLVEEYLSKKAFQKAYDIVKESCKKYQTNYLLWKYKTLIELELNNIENAKQSLQRALFLNSVDDEIWQIKHALDFRTKLKK
jgi:chemotaxis protein methyltransferase CheR